MLKPLQLAAGVVERRQTKPILSHILLTVEGNALSFVGTDLEVELRGLMQTEDAVKAPAQITLPGKKFLDICRALPEGSIVELSENNGRVTLSCGKSRFSMTSLPAEEFPCSPDQDALLSFEIKQKLLKELIGKTAFSIPQQDVRQYLNGLLLEIKDGAIQTLATDGHRLAMCGAPSSIANNSFAQIIIPRKGVYELLRLLEDSDEMVSVSLNNNFIQIKSDAFVLISKLISGKFPNYNKIIPQKGNKKIEINRNELKQSLTRASILSNEMFRSVHFGLRQGVLILASSNPEQEEAIEELAVNYDGINIDITFNIGYFIDILNIIDTETVEIFFKDGDSGIVIAANDSNQNCLYVLMPIRQ